MSEYELAIGNLCHEHSYSELGLLLTSERETLLLDIQQVLIEVGEADSLLIVEQLEARGWKTEFLESCPIK